MSLVGRIPDIFPVTAASRRLRFEVSPGHPMVSPKWPWTSLFVRPQHTSTHTWNLARPVIKYCLRIQLGGQHCISLSDKQKLRWIVANSNDVYISTHIYGFDCFSFSGQNDLHKHFVCPCFSLVNYCDLPRTFELVHPTPSTTAIAEWTWHHDFPTAKEGPFGYSVGHISWTLRICRQVKSATPAGLKARFPPLACTKCERSTPPRFWPAKFLFQPGLQDEESVLFKRVSRSYDMCCVTLAARMEKRNGHENAAYLLKGKVRVGCKWSSSHCKRKNDTIFRAGKDTA